MQNNKNLILFMILAFAIWVGWSSLVVPLIWPPFPRRAVEAAVFTSRALTLGDQSPAGAAALLLTDFDMRVDDGKLVTEVAAKQRAEAAALAKNNEKDKPQPQPVKPKVEQKPVKRHAPIVMGSDDPNSPFFLQVTVTSHGGGVLQVILNRFQKADKMGRPVWLDPPANTIEAPLELIPKDKNEHLPSNLLYQADPGKEEERPFETLGKAEWEVAAVEMTDDGTTARKVVFRTEVGDIVLTKTYALEPGTYHVGLELKFERKAEVDPTKKVQFRYHLTSGHGLPIEGEWYTHVFRNALIGRVDDKGGAYRSLEDLRRISAHAGGDEVLKEGDKSIQYGGIGTQYFTSQVVVDESQGKEKLLARARPILESANVKGQIKSIAGDRKSFVLHATDNHDYTFHLDAQTPENGAFADAAVGDFVAVIYEIDGFDRLVMTDLYLGTAANQLLFDDISVHLVSEAFDVGAGAPVVHKYLLYNGPMKVRLLGQLSGNKAVSPELVARYETTLHLNTMTDAPWQWWGSAFFSAIGWTSLLIACTNIMHGVLWLLHTYVFPWNWGVCVILLTVLVRGMMFPLSRRQAMTSVKMQALAPQIKELQAKYKDDKTALSAATWELYRKHGINPMGSCWMAFLQMPIFLGLFYCLQESIHFRLSPFLWIQNLAAPDMLFWWTESIPFISRPEDYGASWVYLGPYFNLLPIIAVAFMMIQQKMMTPPPTDEQQEMQQKMMKYMTAMFGVIFFKFASGLCIYYIASSVWGFTERKLLPKRKLDPSQLNLNTKKGLIEKLFDRAREATRPAAETSPASGSASTDAATRNDPAPAPPPEPDTGVQSSPQASPPGQGKRNKRNKRKERNKRRNAAAGETPAPPQPNGTNDASAAEKVGGALRKVRDWWTAFVRSAEKRR